jgi:hypothetical protein
LFEVTDDVVFGAWQSGPAFTTQAIIGNHDGTETVTVADNTAVPFSGAHYLRTPISQRCVCT